MTIVKIDCKCFADLYYEMGQLDDEDEAEIRALRHQLSSDDYAGYSPEQYRIYQRIQEILKNNNNRIEVYDFV